MKRIFKSKAIIGLAPFEYKFFSFIKTIVREYYRLLQLRACVCFLFVLVNQSLKAQSSNWIFEYDSLPVAGTRFENAYRLANRNIVCLKLNTYSEGDSQQFIPQMVLVDSTGRFLKVRDLIDNDVKSSYFLMTKYLNYFVVAGTVVASDSDMNVIYILDSNLNIINTAKFTLFDNQQITSTYTNYPNTFFTQDSQSLIITTAYYRDTNTLSFYRVYPDNRIISCKTFHGKIESSEFGLISVSQSLWNGVVILMNLAGDRFYYDSNFELIRKEKINRDTIMNSTQDIYPKGDRYLYYGQLVNVNDADGNIYKIVLCNLDSNFIIIRNDLFRIYDEYEGDLAVDQTPFDSRGLFQLKDSTYIAVTFTFNVLRGSYGNSINIKHFTKGFDLLSDVRYSLPDQIYIPSAASLTPEGRVLISGGVSKLKIEEPGLFYNDRAFLMLLGPNGEMPLGTKKSKLPPEGLISIVQNPVHDYLLLQKNVQNSHFKVSISSLAGELLVANYDFSTDIVKIPVTDLVPGVYIYSINSDKGLVVSGKFVKVE